MNKTRMFAGTAALAALLVALTGCSGDLPAKAGTSHSTTSTQEEVVSAAPVAKDLADSPTIAQIKKDGYLVYGGASESPLFSQFNPTTNKYEGFDAGLAYMFAKYVLGKPEVKFVAVTAANREALLQNGTVEFVANGYSIKPARAETVNFAGPYLTTGDGILVAKDNTSIKSVDDLNGRTVATNPGVGENDVITHAPNAKVITFETGTELVNAVIQGRADAMVLNEPALLSAEFQHKGQVKLVDAKPFTTLSFGIGLPKSDPALKSIVNDWLKKIESNGDYGKLWKATVGDLAPVPTAPEIGSVPGS